MFRRFASKIFTLAPYLTRARTFVNVLKPIAPSQATFKPISAGLAMPKVRPFSAAESDESIKELTKPDEWDNYMKKVSDEKPIIVEFFAKTLTPVMEKKVKAEGGKIMLLKINVDKCPELAAEMGVSSIPHAFLRYKGKFVENFIGHPKDEEIDKFIKKAVDLTKGGQ